VTSEARNDVTICFSLLLSIIITLLLSSTSSCLTLNNLEIIWQKTYVDGAAPESLRDWGRSIACAGDVNDDGYDDIIVAANTRSGDPDDPWLGIAYVFLGGNPMDTVPDVMLTGSKYGSGAATVAGIGDFNHDGYSDVILAQGGGVKAVKVFFGGDTMDTVCDVILQTRPGGSVANAVSGAGDVNGDTIDDCIIGDYLWSHTDGRALIFFGGTSPDGLPDVVLGGHNKEHMGACVGGGGDLDGDGFDDVVVGAEANSDMDTWAGKVYGFFGGTPMDTIPDVWLRGEHSSSYLGAFGVDIVRNGTDYAWLLTGTRFFQNGSPSSPGKIYVMYGDSAMDMLVDAFMIGRTDSSCLGQATAWAGDVDSSGVGDIISGAPFEDSKGAVYLWLGGMPLDSTPDAWATGDPEGQDLGWQVSTAGDVDGDGCDEVLFSNCWGGRSEFTVWVARYNKTGVAETLRGSSAKGLARILQNHPNPFSGETVISLALDLTREATLEIYDVMGAMVRTIAVPASTKEPVYTNVRSVRWDGRDAHNMLVPSGIYLVKLRLTGEDLWAGEARKLVVIR
jgi:hypothetical protein